MGKIIKPLGTIDGALSKQEIVELAEEHAAQIVDSGYDLLRVYIELKRYQTYLDTIIKSLQQNALQQAKEVGEKSFDYSNAKVTVQNRTKYNFGTDPKWTALNQQFETIKKMKKEREKQLKKVAGEYMELVDEETGEVEKLVAPIKEVLNQILIKL